MTLAITPQTKVGALLEAYPGIEDVLIAWVPAFSKLRNPILRKTVAKMATLEQAARIGGVNVRELVSKLRAVTRQDSDETQPESPGCNEADTIEAPSWLAGNRISVRLDAEAILEAGEHPLGKVRESAEALRPGEMVCVTSSFRPVPLIDAFVKSNFQVYSVELTPNRHVTYVARPTGSGA